MSGVTRQGHGRAAASNRFEIAAGSPPPTPRATQAGYLLCMCVNPFLVRRRQGKHSRFLESGHPMPSLTLTDAELVELTGKQRPSAQMRALKYMGIDHKQRADGTLVVARAHFELLLGGGAAPAKPKKTVEPDWSKVH
jgi:hypothetical protein